MEDLVVAQVLKIERHPKADRLKICEVSWGKETSVVVCGAKNVSQNMLTVFAPVGSVTPKGVKIQKATLRGIDSFGMLCSPNDLNVSQETGLIDLPPQYGPGFLVADIEHRFLSSTPWHKFKETERFLLQNDGLIKVQRPPFSEKVEAILFSQTFYDQEAEMFRYRHYSVDTD